MKKIGCILLICVFLLTGCTKSDATELVKGDQTYKTGFYGTLFPNVFTYEEKTMQIGDIYLRQIQHEGFPLYHAETGPYVEGTIYCEEGDYDEALAYYQDPQNYSYHCTLGVDSDTTVETTVELAQVDVDQFEALLNFAAQASYDPFDSDHNSKVETVELPMPDDTKDTRLVFYKESVDQLFVSSTGDAYYVIDGSLYLVYRYDFGHGEYEKLIAVKVPEDIGDYFVSLMSNYLLS